MATSLIRKSARSVRQDGTQAGTDSGQIRIPLKKESLMAEHQIRVQVSQAYAGIVPTSADVRRFMTNVAIETSDQRRIFLTGHQAYDFGRFTENAPAPVVTLGATCTADFVFDLHHENDEALHDLATAIEAGRLTTFDLVIDLAPVGNNGFIGGTLPAASTYTVTARSLGYPGMIFDANGARNSFVESMRHIYERVLTPGTAGAGTSFELRLTSGCLTRLMMLHTFDTTTGVNVPADTVLNNIRLVINGEERDITTFLELRKQNAQKRGFNVVGAACVDYGDDELGFLDLRSVNEPKLVVDIAAGAPASYLITLGQDYSIIMSRK